MSAPRIEEPTYAAAHLRLTSDRGPASSHTCSCGAQAQEWSYDHADPDERTDPRGRAYSLDPEHYQPLCIPCHRRFDKGAECINGHEFTPENTYVYEGHRRCRKCRTAAVQKCRTNRKEQQK